MIWMFKLVIDQVLVPHDFGPFGVDRGGMFGLTLVAGVLGFFDDFLANWIGERFLLDLRHQVLRTPAGALTRLLRSPRRLGDLISRLTSDIALIEAFVLSGVTDALSYVLRIVFFSAALFYLQWDLALISLLVAPLFWLAAKRFSRLIKIASREKRRRSARSARSPRRACRMPRWSRPTARSRPRWRDFTARISGSYHAEMASVRLKALYHR